MKKLMIALGAVAMAACANAAAVTWNWTGTLYDGYNNTGSGYSKSAVKNQTMYIFNENSITRQQVLDQFILNGTMLSGSIDNYETSNGKMNAMAAKTITEDYTTFAPVRDVSGTKYADYFYAMIVGDNLYISEHFDGIVYTTQETNLNGGIADGSQINLGELSKVATTGGWYQAAAVPEPTSGLLLLLGVAGLALKRKRA